MPYSATTRAQLRSLLATRLGDTSSVFYPVSELNRCINESLRTWGAYASYWRDRGVFATVAGTPFYDITTQLPSLLAYTVTDADVLASVQDALMESVTQTEMFSTSEILSAMQRRRDQLLTETGCVLTRSLVPNIGNPSGRAALPQSVIDVRRSAWDTVVAAVVTATDPMFRVDELQLDYGIASWETQPGTPLYFSTILTPPITLQIAPPPSQVGQLDLLTVNSGATLTGAGVVLGIPDDFAWVVKWGTIADLLGKDGQARDPDRSTYAEMRWRQGVELCRINATVLNGQIQGVDNIIDDLWALDVARPSWQTTQQQPDTIATAGRNLVAIANVPDAIYSVTLDVVRNSIVPSVDGDFIQVGNEVMDVIIDYAEHVAAFKMQGIEWKATNRAMDNMLRLASQYNEKLQASALFKSILWPTSGRYKEKQPRMMPEPEQMGAASQ